MRFGYERIESLPVDTIVFTLLVKKRREIEVAWASRTCIMQSKFLTFWDKKMRVLRLDIVRPRENVRGLKI